MVRYRGYVVAKKGPYGKRVAMRDSGKKTFTTKKAGFEYGAVADGLFRDGGEGNKNLLKWYESKKPKKSFSFRI